MRRAASVIRPSQRPTRAAVLGLSESVSQLQLSIRRLCREVP
jgi:hypothetical protein